MTSDNYFPLYFFPWVAFFLSRVKYLLKENLWSSWKDLLNFIDNKYFSAIRNYSFIVYSRFSTFIISISLRVIFIWRSREHRLFNFYILTEMSGFHEKRRILAESFQICLCSQVCFLQHILSHEKINFHVKTSLRSK